MTAAKLDLAALVEEMPDADSPGKSSKLTGPEPETARGIASRIVEAGEEAILELAGMVRDAYGGGEANYKPGYTLHCVALYVGDPGREEEREKFSRALGSKIGGDEPSKDVQRFLIQELQVAGGPESIRVLGKALADPELSDGAAQALVAIGPDAAPALRDALPESRGRCREAVVKALGDVGDAESVSLLAEAAGGEDEAVRIAAVWALGRSGRAAAAETVIESADRAKGWERIQATKACLLLAERLIDSGKKEEGRKIYRHLRDTRSDPPERYVREAAEAALARDKEV